MKRTLSLLLLLALLVGSLSLFSACHAPTTPGGDGGGDLIDVEFLDHLNDYGD